MSRSATANRSSLHMEFFSIDREWVDLVNAERQGQQLDRLSYELFEVIMDKLEKEWFDLVCLELGERH